MRVEISKEVSVETLESTLEMLGAFLECHDCALIAHEQGYQMVPQRHGNVIQATPWFSKQPMVHQTNT